MNTRAKGTTRAGLLRSAEMSTVAAKRAMETKRRSRAQPRRKRSELPAEQIPGYYLG